MSHPHPDDRMAALIQLAHETVARSHEICAESVEVLFLTRAALAQVRLHRSDTLPAGFDTAGSASVLSNGPLERMLSE